MNDAAVRDDGSDSSRLLVELPDEDSSIRVKGDDEVTHLQDSSAGWELFLLAILQLLLLVEILLVIGRRFGKLMAEGERLKVDCLDQRVISSTNG